MSEENSQYEFNTSLPFENVYMPNNYNSININSLKTWIKDPMLHNREIRKASHQLYNQNGIYTNVIDYMVSLPTLDRVVTSQNRNNKKFKTNKTKYIKALKKIKDKVYVRDMLYKGALDGIAFYYFESNESEALPKYLNDTDRSITELNVDFNCSLVPLPTDYCEIVGMKNSSFVAAFDLSYFDGFTGKGRSLKLRRYPKEIRDGYKQYNSDRNRRWLVLDNNKTVTIKVRSKMDEKWGRPLGLSSFVDMLYDEYFVDTKRSVLDEVNSTIIYQTFPEGEKKGKSSLTQGQQEAQHNNIKNALFSKGTTKGINFFSISSGTQLDKLEANVEFLKVKAEDELIKRITTGLGFAGSLLNAESGNFSSQKSNLDLLTSEIMSWIEQIQEELNKVINANIIKEPSMYIEVDYLPLTYANRKEMAGMMKELYSNGAGSLQAWIAALGFNPETYIALMEEEREENFDERFPPHQTSFTLSNKDGQKGQKPIQNDSDNPNTQKNKQTGANPID